MFVRGLKLAVSKVPRSVSSSPVARWNVSSQWAWRRAGPSFTRTIVTKRFTPDHEWVSLDTDTSIATISITDYAQTSLGDVVFVELPTVGSKVEAGDQIGAVESVKAASDVYAPISGTVEEVNTELDTQPSLLNKSPEQDGWLCKIKATNPSELDTLMGDVAYKAHCEGESESH